MRHLVARFTPTTLYGGRGPLIFPRTQQSADTEPSNPPNVSTRPGAATSLRFDGVSVRLDRAGPGKAILDRQGAEGWGTRVIDRLSDDLRAAYPDRRGLSRSNIHNMRQMAAACLKQKLNPLIWTHRASVAGSASRELADESGRSSHEVCRLKLDRHRCPAADDMSSLQPTCHPCNWADLSLVQSR